MKTVSKITLFISLFFSIGIILSDCNSDSSQSKNEPVDTTHQNKLSDCKNGILSATITPSDLQAIKDMPGLKKIYLQFKTNDDKNFYPAAYTKQYPFADVSSNFHTNILQPPFYPNKPYILGNVEWKLKNFSINMSAQLYAIFPAMDDDNIHVTYNYLVIPYQFSYKDSTYNLDSTFFSASGFTEAKRAELLEYVATTATKSINPVPPKQP
jgi:hypothetical protein